MAGVKPKMRSTSYVIPLNELSRADVNRAGGKAARLGELARAGFRVPDGFVLTTGAFDRFLAVNSLGLHSTPQEVASAPIPGDVAEALRSALSDFDDVPLAVRSSGVAEDLAEASFAGQYETVLDVRGEQAVLAAVRRCWASAFSPRVAAYNAAQKRDGRGAMGLLVQRLVPAHAAGVAFTANPVTGDRTETVVSAVRGLGDRLVSGQSSPDEWVVRGQEVVCLRGPESAIEAAQAQAVSALARRVEQHLKEPQDIEWALAGGELFLLQARPITALPGPVENPIPVPVDVPPGFWQREATHYPRPFSPATRSTLLPAMNTALKHVFDELGLLAETIVHRGIGGWQYRSVVPLGGNDGAAPAPEIMTERIKQCIAAVRADRAGHFIDQWYGEWQPELAKGIGELRDIALGGLTDAELDAHLSRVIDLLGEGARIHILLTGTYSYVMYELVVTCRELLGWDEGRTLQLVSGLSARSTEPSLRLAELAQMAKERPGVLDLLERAAGGNVADVTSDRVSEIDPEFANAFAAYQKEYGIRALSYDVADPTLLESPEVVLGFIRDQVRRGYDPAAGAERLERRRRAARAEALKALEGRPPAEGARFERALVRAERTYPIREDNEFFTLSAPLALARLASLEVGRRLVERGAIDRREDVFFLEIEEARAALQNHNDQRPLVRRRRGERAWVEAHPGPAIYGKTPGPPPPLESFPPEVRFCSGALFWTLDTLDAPAMSGRAQAKGATLSGIPASHGRYTGPVRVILGDSEFGKIRAGDVLVCRSTSPVWSILFPSVGSLVTDAGGILCHPAIIAREYCVPAVVATGNATELLQDGQIVTVDGTAGLVEVRS